MFNIPIKRQVTGVGFSKMSAFWQRSTLVYPTTAITGLSITRPVNTSAMPISVW